MSLLVSPLHANTSNIDPGDKEALGRVADPSEYMPTHTEVAKHVIATVLNAMFPPKVDTDYQHQDPERAKLHETAPPHVGAVNIREDKLGVSLSKEMRELFERQILAQIKMEESRDVGSHAYFSVDNILSEVEISEGFKKERDVLLAKVEKRTDLTTVEKEQIKRELTSLKTGEIAHQVFGIVRAAVNPHAAAADVFDTVTSHDHREIRESKGHPWLKDVIDSFDSKAKPSEKDVTVDFKEQLKEVKQSLQFKNKNDDDAGPSGPR